MASVEVIAILRGLFAIPLLGAVVAMVPDPLQVVHALYPREPLKSL
jgi:hypothetical protein